jgi:hypothetical protein
MKAYFTKIHWELSWFWLSDYLKNCKDWFYEITIKKKHKERSLEQNAYMWWIVYDIISKELWYEIDEVHEVMKEKFLMKKISVKTDKRVKFRRIRSTSDLTTVEFEEYMEKIRSFFLYRNESDKKKWIFWIYIPKPNETNFNI